MIIVLVVVLFSNLNLLSINKSIKSRGVENNFGYGDRWPPDNCDLVYGDYLQGDQILNKHNTCLYDLAIKKQDSDICKKSIKYGPNSSDNCLNEVALLKNDYAICNEIESTYRKEDCLISLAKKIAEADIGGALQICGSEENRCHGETLKYFQEVNVIQGKKLVYRCLNYHEGDTITELLCKLNSSYLVGWKGHHDLFYMYGNGYPSMGNKFCGVVASIGVSEKSVERCYERVEGHTQEMSRVGSTFYEFLQDNPSGLGEPN